MLISVKECHKSLLLVSLFSVLGTSVEDAELKTISIEPIRVVICVKNVVNFNHRFADLARMFNSVLRTARSRHLHWVVLIQREEIAFVDSLLRRIVKSQAKVNVQLEYVDLSKITSRYSKQINMTRTHLLCTEPLNSSRFWDEVFHIGNLYHILFPFDRLVVLDLDLEFAVDISHLYEQFRAMDRRGQMIALAYDLTPHYWTQFGRFRAKNPGNNASNTKGFNTGVILMNLNRMRQSALYNSFIDEIKLKQLIVKYEWEGCIGYQDFFTLLGVEHPELFHVLDCTWNRQLDDIMSYDIQYANIFPYFHRCDGLVKIYHANGASVMPGDDFFPKNGDMILKSEP